jgi:hypothetical protein
MNIINYRLTHAELTAEVVRLRAELAKCCARLAVPTPAEATLDAMAGLVVELSRVRGERDRLFVELVHDDQVGRAAPDEERPWGSSVGIVISMMRKGCLPAGETAARLAEHDRRAGGSAGGAEVER